MRVTWFILSALLQETEGTAVQACSDGYEIDGTDPDTAKFNCGAGKVIANDNCAADPCVEGSADDGTCCVDPPQTCAMGYELDGTDPDTAKFNCGAGKVIADASCAANPCVEGSADDGTCCVDPPQTCAMGYELDGTDPDTAKFNCGAGKVIADASCAADPCVEGSADDGTCCLARMTCADGFEVSTAETAKINCAVNLMVTGDHCAGATCVDATDKAACCMGPMTCAMGFEAAGGNTDKIDCAANMLVASGTTCDGVACDDTTDKAACCVAPQTCAAGFKVSTASGDKIACAAGKMVSSASCTGLECDGTDDVAACCVDAPADEETSTSTTNNDSADADGAERFGGLALASIGLLSILH